jgi:hypothetical protein
MKKKRQGNIIKPFPGKTGVERASEQKIILQSLEETEGQRMIGSMIQYSQENKLLAVLKGNLS